MEGSRCFESGRNRYECDRGDSNVSLALGVSSIRPRIGVIRQRGSEVGRLPFHTFFFKATEGPTLACQAVLKTVALIGLGVQFPPLPLNSVGIRLDEEHRWIRCKAETSCKFESCSHRHAVCSRMQHKAGEPRRWVLGLASKPSGRESGRSSILPPAVRRLK